MTGRILLLLCTLAGCTKPPASWLPPTTARQATARAGLFLQAQSDNCTKHPSKTVGGASHCVWLAAQSFAWSVVHCFHGCPALQRADFALNDAALSRQAAIRLRAQRQKTTGRPSQAPQAPGRPAHILNTWFACPTRAEYERIWHRVRRKAEATISTGAQINAALEAQQDKVAQGCVHLPARAKIHVYARSGFRIETGVPDSSARYWTTRAVLDSQQQVRP